MKNTRIIARLDIKGPNVVKGVHLEGLRVLGRPEDFAEYYYQQGADELFYMDVVASLYGRNSLLELVSKTAEQVFMPITVGGGLRSIADIRRVLRAGADKVCLNTAAVENPTLVSDAAAIFGSSTIVVAIEAIRQPSGEYFAFINNGREHTGLEIFDWAERLAAMGAGEIVITSVDREGTGKGFDCELVRRMATSLKVPVIAHGGAGKAADVIEVIGDGCADAVAIASMFHYHTITQMTQSDQTGEGNRAFLSSGRQFKKVDAMSVADLKRQLLAAGIDVRRPHA
jgi:imidazole glycerol-phosphate synthase subunit HisF